MGFLNLNHSRHATHQLNQDIGSLGLDIIGLNELYYLDSASHYKVIGDINALGVVVIVNNNVLISVIKIKRDLIIVFYLE